MFLIHSIYSYSILFSYFMITPMSDVIVTLLFTLYIHLILEAFLPFYQPLSNLLHLLQLIQLRYRLLRFFKIQLSTLFPILLFPLPSATKIIRNEVTLPIAASNHVPLLPPLFRSRQLVSEGKKR